MRIAGLVALVFVVAACGAAATTGPTASPTVPPVITAARSPVVWGDSVPTPGPEAVITLHVIHRGTDTITLLPISPTGAAIGVAYHYVMPHCGILSPIDVDGSFWDPVDAGSASTTFDDQAGLFRLDSANDATFTATDGSAVHLTRHSGSEEFPYCS